MAQWLKLILLVSELSFVLSSVIIIKIDEDEWNYTQIDTIEGKIDKQIEELKQLKNALRFQNDEISYLNSTLSTYQSTYNLQQQQIKNLTGQNRKLQENVQEIRNHVKNGMCLLY